MNILGTIIHLFIVAIFGSVLFYIAGFFHDETNLVIVAESTECEVLDYSIILGEKTISATPEQMNKSQYQEKHTYEKYFSFIGAEGEDGYFSYRVKGRYRDCDEVIGPLNKVKRGWMIYERIHEDQVIHDVRSK